MLKNISFFADFTCKSMFKGEGGVPWVQIMENELECIGDRRGHDGHLAKKLKKKIIPSPSYRGYRVAIWLLLLGNS